MECIIQARARVKERYQNIRANVLYCRLDPKGRGLDETTTYPRIQART
jgi:hypothetical protein